MPNASACPTMDRWRRLIAGSLPDDEQAELVAHLDGCAVCRRALDDLSGATPALLSAAGALGQVSYAAELPLRRVLHRLANDADLTLPFPPPGEAARGRVLLRSADVLEALERLEGYDVQELLGQGGMGVVLRALDRALKRPVAIKALAPDLAGDAVARQRFEREAQAAAAVRHPHVITIHAVSAVQGLPYFVMEYAAGGSLQDYLDRHGPGDWRAAARLGAAVAAGLEAAHARGLVHRDIKPSNILLPGGEDKPADLGTAKIGDFGLAYAADQARLTQTGIVAGTPLYMAPEQALGQRVDERADLFSLGSVLYRVLTGREAFAADGPMAVLRQVCEMTPPPIRGLNPAVPPWLAATVERLHAKRPADRFGSAAEVAELLRYNLEHPDRPRPVRPPAGGPGRRRRWVGAVVAVGLLVVGAWLLADRQGWLTIVPSAWHGAPSNQVRLLAELKGHTMPVMAVAFTPDGRTFVTGGDDRTLRFWDVATGRETAQRSGHDSAVTALAVAHSGRFLVSGGGDNSVRLWDLPGGQERAALPHRGGSVRRLAIAPDDQTVAVVSSSQGVELWDVDRGTLRRSLPGGHGSIFAFAFAPDGKVLATGDAGGHVRLWDPTTGAERAAFPADPLSVRALAFAPDSRTLASAGRGDKGVKLWQPDPPEPAGRLADDEADIANLVFTRDGRRLCAGDRHGTVHVWDVALERPLAFWTAHEGSVFGLAVSRDGRTLATAGEDHRVKLWDLSGLGIDRP